MHAFDRKSPAVQPEGHRLQRLSCLRAADPAESSPSQALQRIRERLELAAIVAGCNHPEQAAAALLGEGVAQ